MYDSEAQDVLSQIITNKLYGPKSIEEYLQSKQIPVRDWSLILAKMTELNFTDYSYFIFATIRKYLDQLASGDDSDFLALLDNLAKQEEKDPGSNYLYFLYEIPKRKNLQIAIDLYPKIRNSKTIQLRIGSAYLLAGIGSDSNDKLFDEIVNNKDSLDSSNILLHIRALKILAYNNKISSLPYPIADFIIKCTGSQNNLIKE